MDKYNPQKIEKKWQKYWEKNKIFRTKDAVRKPKYYVLDMFPYPSGAGLHVGHPKGYIATDVVARMKMMQGYNVLHPMGWDAFGLPTENYAIKNKIHPAEATKKNIATYRRQLDLFGFTYDWDREINTTDPKYYQWTQWIFLQMFKRGLAYESYEPINWCPSCQTGLANEDLEEGKCERCGSLVERKPLRQWVLKITDYAERLLNDLEKLPAWEESIKEMQRNWIGRSEGALVKFEIRNSKFEIPVFTTRPDTLFGATYMVVAPEHPLVASLLKISNFKFQISNIEEVKKYVENAKRKSDLERTDLIKEKTGVEIKGLKAVNPVNGEELPIFVADYVLMGYGTGAIMAVPAHDERDWEFAKKFGLPIKEVVVKKFGERKKDAKRGDGVAAVMIYEGKTLILYNKKYNYYRLPAGRGDIGEDDVQILKREIIEETGYTNFEIKDYLGQVEHNIYVPSLRENRIKLQKGYLVFLKNKNSQPQNAEDDGVYERVWLSPTEAIAKLKTNSEPWGEYEFIERYLNRNLICFTGDGINVNSGFLNNLPTAEAKEKMIQWLEEKEVGKRQVQYKLRDWVFSRQRYWGEPIPLVKCEKCGWTPVPEKDLPLELPKVKHYEPTGTGESPLANIKEWVNTKCPRCGGAGQRETNTMPQWAGSCWYYIAYCMPHNKKGYIWDKEKINYWIGRRLAPRSSSEAQSEGGVDLYVGGGEHATRHLIYARFWHKFLFDIGVVSHDEPFSRLQHVGLILAEDGRKMSKRWGNVINPDDVVKQYGADSLRLYEMFMGPFDQPCAWSTQGVVGVRRFLEKVWEQQDKVAQNVIPAKAGIQKVSKLDSPIESGNDNLEHLLHKTIQKVTEDIENFKFNTAISALMILANEMSQIETISNIQYSIFLKLLSPFAPHIAEELWSRLGNKESIIKEKWPTHDPALAKDEEMNLVIQINGKVRDNVLVPADLSEDEAKQKALASEKIQKWLEGKEPKKVIYVKGKLVSIVI